MDPAKQLEDLKESAKLIQADIKEKEKSIELLKAALKFDNKRLKGVNEEIEFYKTQVDANPQPKKG